MSEATLKRFDRKEIQVREARRGVIKGLAKRLGASFFGVEATFNSLPDSERDNHISRYCEKLRIEHPNDYESSNTIEVRTLRQFLDYVSEEIAAEQEEGVYVPNSRYQNPVPAF